MDCRVTNVIQEQWKLIQCTHTRVSEQHMFATVLVHKEPMLCVHISKRTRIYTSTRTKACIHTHLHTRMCACVGACTPHVHAHYPRLYTRHARAPAHSIQDLGPSLHRYIGELTIKHKFTNSKQYSISHRWNRKGVIERFGALWEMGSMTHNTPQCLWHT